MKSSRRLKGFTLVELLVVIAIIGVLVALLLPAVQAAREAARRTQCSNNCKQIGLAAHNFHSTYRTFPPGALRSPTSGAMTAICTRFGVKTNGVNHAWSIFLLPYLEQQRLRDSYDLNANWAATMNQSVRETPLQTFVCPSTPSGLGRVCVQTVSSVVVQAAAGDYAPNNAYSSALEGAGFADVAVNRNGVLQVNQAWSIPEILDGTSNTLMISEDAGRPDYYQRRTRIATGTQTDGGWADHNSEYITHGIAADLVSSPGPCHTNCNNGNEVYSFHSGGAMHVLADGSVRFVAESMDMRAFVKLLTRAGNDVVSDF